MGAGVVWRRRSARSATAVGAVSLVLLGAVAPATAGPPNSKPPTKSEKAAKLPKEPKGTDWGDKGADRLALDAYGMNEAKQDPGSLYTITRAIGARDLWHAKDAQGRAITGRGVTVAVVDSGVAPVSGLDAAGKLVQGPDLSLEAASEVAMSPDTFGHGTHLAGIIAGSDPVERDKKSGEPKADDASLQLGVAPDAQVLALKLATTDGSTDVSQVIAGLDWVVDHRHDNGMDVRVVNLSYGTTALQPYEIDPLAAAAEHAWRAGLVVVVSAGNAGSDSEGLTNPAIDPYVLAVGASDPQGDVKGWDHPAVASFSSVGTTVRPVDLLAPGRSVVSLRDPGSFVDSTHPEGRLLGDSSNRLFRGSGTSQAAAVVSGAAALLLQAHPDLTPDAVKAALMDSARREKGMDQLAAGAGQLDVKGALATLDRAYKAKNPSRTVLSSPQTWPTATGTGSLDLARGGYRLVDPQDGTELSGERDVHGNPFDTAAWSAASMAGTSWAGGEFMRARWSGDGWTGARWSDDSWAGARWSGARWSGARWSDDSWAGARWSGARWSGARWSGARWSGARWSGARWSGAHWS